MHIVAGTFSVLGMPVFMRCVILSHEESMLKAMYAWGECLRTEDLDVHAPECVREQVNDF